MNKTEITDVFFDLDHTLWDFEKNSGLTYEILFQRNAVGVELNDFLDAYSPVNFMYWKLYREGKISKENLRYHRLKDVFDVLGYPVTDTLISILSEEYIELLPTHTHLIPYACDILDYLQHNYRLHIITNGFEEVQASKLTNSGIAGYFKHVVNSEMAGVKKPHPHIFNLALQKAEVLPQNAVMIGDSLEADIEGAMALGFQALHLIRENDPLHEICPLIRCLSEIKLYL